MIREIDFEEWYDLLQNELQKKGYSKSPDWDTAKVDYLADMAPDESAASFAEEWGYPGSEQID